MAKQSTPPFDSIVTVTPNTSIDCIFAAPGFAIGAHTKGRRLARQPAGKGVNVSRALAALGHRNIATGFVGERELEAFDQMAAIKHCQPQFMAVPGDTRENITVLDPDRGIETHVRTTGFNVDERSLARLEHKLQLLAKPGVLVVFAGSLPPGMDADALFRMIDQTRSAGSAIALDVEPAALRRAFDHGSWLIKCNRAEFREALPDVEDTEEAIIRAGREASRKGGTLIVTCGAAGCYAFSHGSAWMGQVEVSKEAVISTVGCGDALMAGYIAAMQNGDSVSDACMFALEIATAAAESAIPGEFSPSDVERLRSKTSVIAIDDAK